MEKKTTEFDLFDRIEIELTTHISHINRRVVQLPQFTGERKKSAIQEIERDFGNADQLVKQLEAAAKTIQHRHKVRSLDSELALLKANISKIKRTIHDYLTEREALFASSADDFQNRKQESRSAALSNLEKLKEADQRIGNSRRLVSQSEEVGTSTIVEIKRQNESLLRNINSMETVHDTMDTSRSLIFQMTTTVLKNKLVLVGIIIVLLIAIGLVVYFKWIHSSSSPSQPPPSEPPPPAP